MEHTILHHIGIRQRERVDEGEGTDSVKDAISVEGKREEGKAVALSAPSVCMAIAPR